MCIILQGVFGVKRRELIRRLKKVGFRFERHGGDHDIYRKGTHIESIPRHSEINERLAYAILKKWNA